MSVLHTLPSGATLTDTGQPDATLKPGIIVIPGGGYEYHSAHETECIAEWLESIGLRAFVLRYRLQPDLHPAPLEDAQTAIRLVRENAVSWGVHAGVMGVIGFSAGGHIASTVSTRWSDRTERPDFAVLVYPVISMGPLGHAGSRGFLLGPTPDPEVVASLSNETQVTSETPSTFIVHGANDKTVSVRNALVYAMALSEAGVPFELHCPRNMLHDTAMSVVGTPSDWRPAASEWLLVITEALLSKSSPPLT